MSSMAFGGGGLASVARVAFEVDTGEASRDIERFERRYRDSAGELSDAAIKVELSQRRLQRALKDGPAAYEKQARAELALRNSERELRQENDRLERSFRDTNRSIGQAGRGAAAGSGLFAGMGRSVAFASASFLGSAGLVYAMRSAINVASNLEEQENKVRATFQGSADDVLKWSRTTSDAYGIARDQALAYSATLGGILNGSGLVRAESARLGQQFVELGGDMASFNNASPEETLEALRAAIVGEYEPLRRYQVVLSEARVSQEALRLSGKASKDELTDREKVLARVALILQKTADQQGDAAKTSREFAGSTRRLNAGLRDLQGNLGQLVIPAATEFVEILNEGTDAANRLSAALSARTGGFGLGDIFKGVVTRTGPLGAFTNTRDLLKLIGSDGISGGDFDKLKQLARQGRLSGSDLERLRQFLSDDRYAELRNILVARSRRRSDQQAPPRGEGRPTPIEEEQDRDGRPRRRRRRSLLDIEIDVARALTTPSTSDEAALYREQVERFERQIRNLERRKNLTEKQKQALRALYGNLAAAQSSLDAIADAEEARIDEQREAAREARARKADERRRRFEAAKEREEERMRRVRDSAARAAERRLDLLGDVPGTRRRMRRAALRGEETEREKQRERLFNLVESRTKIAELSNRIQGFGNDPLRQGQVTPEQLARWRDEMRRHPADAPATLGQIKSALFDQLVGFRQTIEQYGGNLFAPGSLQVAGAPNPELFQLVTLAREQNYMIAGLASGLRNPGSKYAGTEIAHMFDGFF